MERAEERNSTGVREKKLLWDYMGFLGSSAGKESACNSGNPGLIPGLGRFLGEGIVYPLQYSWTFLVVQLVKNHTPI